VSGSRDPSRLPNAADASYRLQGSRRPGEEVQYRNVNNALLGEVITRASGLEYADYVRREVLEPLGMQASFGLTDDMRAPRVGIGLGWKFGRVADRVFLNHEGGGAGFTSELRLYPASQPGIALAMNAMRMPQTMRVAHRVCEAVFARRVELAREYESQG
jgi:CubicO group peptidase (beta-lactamase class C family)